MFGGLLFGLILLFGLVAAVCIVAFFQHIPLPVWLLVVGIIVIAEILFWLDRKQPTGNRFWFTAGRKGLSLLFSLLVVVVLGGLYNSGKEAISFFGRIDWQRTVCFVGYVGLVLLCIAAILFVVWGYIKINSLKYKGGDMNGTNRNNTPRNNRAHKRKAKAGRNQIQKAKKRTPKGKQKAKA